MKRIHVPSALRELVVALNLVRPISEIPNVSDWVLDKIGEVSRVVGLSF